MFADYFDDLGARTNKIRSAGSKGWRAKKEVGKEGGRERREKGKGKRTAHPAKSASITQVNVNLNDRVMSTSCNHLLASGKKSVEPLYATATTPSRPQ